MRLDGSGNKCPATLGEYRRICASIGGEGCRAVKFLDAEILDKGEDMEVTASDDVMRRLLFPLLIEE